MNPLYLILAAVVLFAFVRKPKGTAVTPGATLARIAQKWGGDIARNVERIYRLETRNFTSGLFTKTNAAGMAALSNTFPFGWPARGTTADMFNPVVSMRENNPATGEPQGTPIPFVAFKRFDDAAEYLAAFLADHGNNAGRWKSTTPAIQASYNAAVAAITPTFTKDL